MIFKNERSPFVAKSAFRRRSSTLLCSPGGRSRPSSKKKSNIKVCVRLRPANSLEADNGRLAVRVVDDTMLVFDPLEHHEPTFFKGKAIRDPTKRRNRDLKFGFDSVFDAEACNADVYEHTTKPIVDKLLEGVNCSVFAYGATGAGKTYTMVGNARQPGVIIDTVLDLYDKIDAISDDITCDVQVSYLEVYNENVRDLFKPENGNLPLREDGDLGVTAANLSHHRPTDAQNLLSMLEDGNRNRTQHATDANAESSRSHAVFQICLTQRPRTPGTDIEVLSSKMALIDLAGSERAAATANSGERFREGANINRSLLALGNCISALADGKRGAAHIPYRDSKLTRLLKDSLGGNCHTVMIANLSPSALSYEDSYNTLKYADRAKRIKTDAHKNAFRVEHHVHQYAKIVQDLQHQVGELKQKLSSATQQNLMWSDRVETLERRLKNRPVASSNAARWTWLGELLPLVEAYGKMQSEALNRESQSGLERLKLADRHMLQTYLDLIQPAHVAAANAASCRTERICAQSAVKQQFLSDKLSAITEGLQHMRHELETTFSAMARPDGDEVKLVLDSLGSRLRLAHCRGVGEHLKALVLNREALIGRQDRLIVAALSLLRKQQLLIQGANFVTPELQAEWDAVFKLVKGAKEVVFDEDSQGRRRALETDLTDRSLVFTADGVATGSGCDIGAETICSSSQASQPAELAVSPKKPSEISASKSVRSLRFDDAIKEEKSEKDVNCRSDRTFVVPEVKSPADETFTVLKPLGQPATNVVIIQDAPVPENALPTLTDEHLLLAHGQSETRPRRFRSPPPPLKLSPTIDLSPIKDMSPLELPVVLPLNEGWVKTEPSGSNDGRTVSGFTGPSPVVGGSNDVAFGGACGIGGRSIDDLSSKSGSNDGGTGCGFAGPRTVLGGANDVGYGNAWAVGGRSIDRPPIKKEVPEAVVSGSSENKFGSNVASTASWSIDTNKSPMQSTTSESTSVPNNVLQPADENVFKRPMAPPVLVGKAVCRKGQSTNREKKQAIERPPRGILKPNRLNVENGTSWRSPLFRSPSHSKLTDTENKPPPAEYSKLKKAHSSTQLGNRKWCF